MKKQNTITKIFGILLFLFIINSCSDLEPEIFDKLSPENYPQSDEDIAAAVTGIYNTVTVAWSPTYLDPSHWIMNMMPTDELTTAWGHLWRENNEFLWTENSSHVKRNYFLYVKGISKATLLLDELESIELQNVTAKKQYVAELHALRGYFAFQLRDLYGTFPLVTDLDILRDVDNRPDLQKSSDEEIVKFIEDELNLAIPDLRASFDSDTDWGRITKGAAYTMLMKLYLHEKNWQGVKDVSNNIMGLGYQLLDYYPDIFDIANESFSNKEIIWVIPKLSDPGSLGHTWFATCLPQVPRYKSLTGITINIWGGLKTPWDFYDTYEEGVDERLTRLIRYYEDTDGNMVDFRTVSHYKAVGAAPKKYSEDPAHKGDKQGSDLIRYRYADVLLARAEALNELNGTNSESISLINQVRTRAKVGEVNIADFNKESLRDFILEERGRELFCEGHRRQDLIRQGKFISKAHEQGYSGAADKHILFPIPQSAIDENPSIIQNPGY